MKRRTFLRGAGGAAVGALSGAGPTAAGAKAVTVTILHTNDIHGHLTAWQGWDGDLKGKTVGGLGRLAGAVARERKAAGEGNVLLLDAGDLLGDTMLADLTEGKALVEALNFLKYDALTVGNHEPDFGTDALKKRMAEASFPTVACNLTEKASGKLFTKPYVIREVGGVKVGILGLAYPKTARTTAAKNVAAVEFHPPGPAVKEYLPKVRADGAEVVVALSHLGLGADLRLAKEVTGIDVIVGGHSHNRMAEGHEGRRHARRPGRGARVGPRPARPHRRGRQGHRPQADADPARPTTSSPPTRRPRSSSPGCSIRTARRSTRWSGRPPGGSSERTRSAGQDARKRDAESPVDSLFADILRAATKADVCLSCPGSGTGWRSRPAR